MIEAAALLSALVQHWADLIIILVLLLANAIVGFWEEFQAGNAIAALKANLALKARVKRNGAWSEVPARELVPGDLVRLRLGDIVPADARLLEGEPVEVDQSALTGESLPVSRKTGEVGLFRLDSQAGGDRRRGFGHRQGDLLWQDRAIGRIGAHRQPFPEGGPQDRQLPHYSGGGSGHPDHCVWPCFVATSLSPPSSSRWC